MLTRKTVLRVNYILHLKKISLDFFTLFVCLFVCLLFSLGLVWFCLAFFVSQQNMNQTPLHKCSGCYDHSFWVYFRAQKRQSHSVFVL